jgi:pyruvate dehydrogenase E2 component (dihydrolipoamide acetyltransferase)
MRVPEVAAGATEAVLSEWLVAEGASVQVGDPIAVIETDKAQVEVEADAAAVIIKLLVEDSRQIEIGAPMAVLGTKEEAGADVDELLASLGLSSEVSATSPAPPRRDVPDPERESPAPGQDPAPQQVSDTVETTHGRAVSPTAAGRQFISPIARRLLRDAGLDATSIVGTGPGGRVVRRDVESAIAEAAATAASREDETAPSSVPTASARQQSATSGTFGAQPAESVEHSRMRRAVAGRLTASKQTIPHFYLKRKVDIGALLRLRADLNERTERKISVNDFVLRAVAQAHVDVPDANVIWTDETMHRFDTVDVAVAIASDRGLVTPVLRSVERMSLGTISSEVKGFVERANAGKLQQRELEGGTISVTNLGMYGVDEFAAIINPPQSAILAVGAGKPQPVVVDDRIEVATLMSLVLSVDHRALDGLLAAQWMSAVVDALENPFRLLV